jgi:hypothetical protein
VRLPRVVLIEQSVNHVLDVALVIDRVENAPS